METKLERISQLSRENPNMVFTLIGHLINKEMLKSCHEVMDEEKAVGIDGVTKEEYIRNLDQNLESLVKRLKKKSYKPKPARLVEIPKDNGKMRPLSIYSYEDKLVQEALRRILEAVFEPCFYDEMMGFRPNRSCHKAIQKLNTMIQSKPVSYVLDADIKGFFDHMDHEWIIRFIESKIKDPNITRLVRRMLKAEIMKDYQYEDTEEGSGQGSVCSPIISCIYIFGLSLEEEKSRLIEFGRFAQERCAKRGTKPETFTFLGFTHYCSQGKNGKFRVKRKTSRKKFAKKCKEVHRLIGSMRTLTMEEIILKLNRILTGYYHYYGITDNTPSIKKFRYNVLKSLFYWINRRSQKQSYNWNEFLRTIDANYQLAKGRVYVSVYE